MGAQGGELEGAPGTEVAEGSVSRAKLLEELADVLREEAWRHDFIEDRMPFVMAYIPEGTINHLWLPTAERRRFIIEGIPPPSRPTRNLVARRESIFFAADKADNYPVAYEALIARVDVILNSTLHDWNQEALSSAYSQAEEYGLVRGLPLTLLEEGGGFPSRQSVVETKLFVQGYEDPGETLGILEAVVTLQEPGEERENMLREIRRTRQWWQFSSGSVWPGGKRPELPTLDSEMQALIEEQRIRERDQREGEASWIQETLW